MSARDPCRLCAQDARIKQRLTELVRDGRRSMVTGGRRAARRVRSGSRRSASSDHRTAVRITQTSEALRQPAGARPRDEHGRVVARPGRGCCGVRDAGERCRARACRGRQAAERDRAGGAHARAAHGRGRPGALCAAGVEHDVGRVGGASCVSAAGCRSSRASSSSRRSGTSPSSSARPTSRPAASSSGSSRPPTRS